MLPTIIDGVAEVNPCTDQRMAESGDRVKGERLTDGAELTFMIKACPRDTTHMV